MKYKVGDEVRIKGTDIGGTIESIIRGQLIVETKGSKIPVWPEEVVLIEGLVEEEEIEFTEEDKYWCDIMSESDPTTYVLPEGYIFKDENGNVINATKIVLEKKKKDYPKTYEECCKVMNYCCNPLSVKTTHKEELIRRFQFLLLYRDAYWKIAGEEMGLGKPWEPDWNSLEPKYVISISKNSVKLIWEQYYHRVFAFPTAEMRDAFYENFKELIELCKELL